MRLASAIEAAIAAEVNARLQPAIREQVDVEIAARLATARRLAERPRWVLTARPEPVATVKITNNGGAVHAVHVESAWELMQVTSKGSWSSFDSDDSETFTVDWQEEHMLGYGRPKVRLTWCNDVGDRDEAVVRIISVATPVD